jgi:hypothetical protein
VLAILFDAVPQCRNIDRKAEACRISLNWPMNAQSGTPFYNRRVFHQKLWNKAPRVVNDDEWTFNTQSSSQWDGLRHYGYQKEKRFYNGITLDDFFGEHKTDVLGIQNMSEQGIVGRGVLLDYYTWCKDNKVSYDPWSSNPISVSQLKAVAEAQGTEIKFGDILLTRTGFIKEHTERLNSKPGDLEELAKAGPPHPFSGLEQSEEMLEWLWDHFAAIGGDQPAIECWPSKQDWTIHEVLLSGWGCPLGELFDLEKLAKQCKDEGRYSFFLTSEPCNVSYICSLGICTPGQDQTVKTLIGSWRRSKSTKRFGNILTILTICLQHVIQLQL